MKEVHWECYRRHMLKVNDPDESKRKPHFLPDSCSEFKVVCTRKCLEKAARDHHHLHQAEEGISANIPWDRDGADGVKDPNNSEAILVEWLSDFENFKKWKGDDVSGKTKTVICGEIADLINSKNVRKKRTAEMVKAKINTMLSLHKKAADWAANTGQG